MSQVFASLLLLVLLAIPLLVRLSLLIDFTSVLAVVSGAGFILFLATSSGIISKGKKLFEMVFFFVTYANINGIPFLDYYGGLSNESVYLIKLISFVLLLASFTFLFKMQDIKK